MGGNKNEISWVTSQIAYIPFFSLVSYRVVVFVALSISRLKIETRLVFAERWPYVHRGRCSTFILRGFSIHFRFAMHVCCLLFFFLWYFYNSNLNVNIYFIYKFAWVRLVILLYVWMRCRGIIVRINSCLSLYDVFLLFLFFSVFEMLNCVVCARAGSIDFRKRESRTAEEKGCNEK